MAAAAGTGRLQGAGRTGNSVREVLDLLDGVMNQMGVTKQELARRSGVSRQRLTELFGPIESRPILETIVRIAVGLNFPLEVVSEGDDRLDDGPTPETPPTQDGSAGTTAESESRNTAAFATAMLGSSLIPLLGKGGTMVYVGAGLAGAAVVGIGFTFERPPARHAAFFIGAGIFAGTLVAGLARALGARSAGVRNGGAHAD